MTSPFKVIIIVLITCQRFWNWSFHLWLTSVTVMYGWKYLEKASILCVICLKVCSAINVCFSYFNIIYNHKIPAEVQLKEIRINTTHACWMKFKNVNKILNKLFITSCYSKMGERPHVTSNCVQCYTDTISCVLWYSKFINQIIS